MIQDGRPEWVAEDDLLDRADAPLVGLNLFWLLLVVVTPFLTRILTEGDVQFVTFALYAVAQAVQMGTFAVWALVPMLGERLLRRTGVIVGD